MKIKCPYHIVYLITLIILSMHVSKFDEPYGFSSFVLLVLCAWIMKG